MEPRIVVTGTVVDRDGNPVGDLYTSATEAVDAIEGLVAELGLQAA